MPTENLSKAAVPAPAPAADAHVDENGNPCSKNAYKKRMKAQAAAKKKKEKEAAKALVAASTPAKKEEPKGGRNYRPEFVFRKSS